MVLKLKNFLLSALKIDIIFLEIEKGIEDMARTFRRKGAILGSPEYHRDLGRSWRRPWSMSLKEEANSKCRSHFKEELSKFFKNNEYEVALNKKYGNPWHWD